MTNRRPNLIAATAILVGSGLLPLIGCAAVSDAPAELDSADESGLTYEEWKATVYRDPGGVWIVNGDTPISSERKLQEFYKEHVQKGALTVAQSRGVDAKWNDSQKLAITYCVSESFGGQYQTVVDAMNEAAGAWEAAANIDFIHMADQDGNCTDSNPSVVFDTNPVDAQGQYVARAFFPNYPRFARNVLIDGSSFGVNGPLTLAGILRHELGHTLGFRHEQTRPEAGTCFEDDNYRPLTDYDSASVMHYPQCNGTNQGDLVLTEKDQEGAALLYGAPGGGDPGDPGDPGGGACAHDKCEAGMALDPGCDPCVEKIAQADDYCVSTEWDSTCVQEVEQICGESCAVGGGGGATCAHDVCQAGEALDPSCDPCAMQIAQADEYCVSTEWDDFCVQMVAEVCGQTCQ